MIVLLLNTAAGWCWCWLVGNIARKQTTIKRRRRTTTADRANKQQNCCWWKKLEARRSIGPAVQQQQWLVTINRSVNEQQNS
jgi:hypothetical protein